RGMDRVRYGGDRLDEKRLRILSYAGYRRADELRVSGRIVEYRKPLNPGQSTLGRLRAMLAIYESDEVPGVRVRMEAYGEYHETVSDSEGYFRFRVPLAVRPMPVRTAWETVTVSTPDRESHRETVDLPVLAPGTEGALGIISDIDDTVVETGATNFLKNWKRVLVHQPADRLAVPGASRLYRMLVVDHEAPQRPVFYVSSSPWNLYGFITEFMELNGIPHGPMFLKDYGLDDAKFISGGHNTHKVAAIETILAFYPDFRFLLIGDNGQKDVEVYATVAADFPDNVAGVFIRDVSGTCREGKNGDRLAGIEARGIPVYCGEGFDEALDMVETVGFHTDTAADVEAAKAAVTGR
ncbi:MAG: phosphatase domain-containing protein, partial [Pacificimonas sp.]|nr:phosphatase domain-containing protein [Pacificimonas sp.]